MKLPYNKASRCTMHRDEISAICPRCYEAALRQQHEQWKAEREAAHAEYLKRYRAAA